MNSTTMPDAHRVPLEATTGYHAIPASSQPGMISFDHIWRVIRARSRAIALIMAGCLIAGLIITLLTTQQYTAESRLEISRQNANVADVEGVNQEDFSQNLEFYETQYSLLESRSLADRVARSLNLLADDSFGAAFDVGREGDPGSTQALTAAERSQRLRSASDILLDKISIEPVRGSSLVDVKFTSPDPGLSARITNEWVDQFIQSNMDRRFGSTADAREFLEERLAELRERLEESERNLVNYASSQSIVTLSSTQDAEGRTSTQRTLVSSDLEALNDALARATAARVAAEAQATQGRGANREVVTNQAVASLRQKRAEVVAERAALLTQFEPEYPSVAALTSQVVELERAIATEEGRVNSGRANSFQEALRNEQELQRRVDELLTSFNDERRDTIQYNIFQREVDTTRELYDSLLQRYKEIGVAGIGSNNTAIVDRAEPPENPSSPVLLLNLALAFIAGIALSSGYVFAAEQIDQSLKDPAAVKSALGLALLGSVPENDGRDMIESLNDRKSDASEAYFSVVTNLSFITDHGVPRTFLVTSTRPNEGKTTSSYAIAHILARTGKKVILIDADMRSPSIHVMVNRSNDTGMSNYLSGTDDIDSLIGPVPGSDLFSMSAGPMPPNAAELLGTKRVEQMFDLLKQRFDHVVVDGPPVLGLADVPLLASSVEGVIYTIEANGVKMRGIQAAIDRIRASHAHIFGGIVTKLNSVNSAYGYGYTAGYGYGYGRDKKDV